MKVYELVEARRNPEINNQRGRDALFDYLKSLPEDVLNRTYVHLSMINKVGVNPTEFSATIGDPFEPMGVFTYRAPHYLSNRGTVKYASSYPIVHVITIREDQHNVLSNMKFQKFQRQLQKLYPDGNTSRATVTRRLIYKGYTVVNTDTVDGESVIVDSRAIERTKTFEVEHIRPDEIAGADILSNGTLEWDGSKHVTGLERSGKQVRYERQIRNNQILNHANEYELALIDPDLYQEYISQVLAPQNLQPKLSTQEQRAAQRRHRAARNRLPYQPPQDSTEWKDNHKDDDSTVRYPDTDEYDGQYLRPSMQAAPKLYNYVRLTKKPLTRDQEITMLSKGAFLTTDYALEYYKLLASWGMKPQLSDKEIYDVIANHRTMIDMDTHDSNPRQFVRRVQSIFT